MIYKTVCEDCSRPFDAKTNLAHYCSRCLQKRWSSYAKGRNLNRLGNEAYSRQRALIRKEKRKCNGKSVATE